MTNERRPLGWSKARVHWGCVDGTRGCGEWLDTPMALQVAYALSQEVGPCKRTVVVELPNGSLLRPVVLREESCCKKNVGAALVIFGFWLMLSGRGILIGMTLILVGLTPFVEVEE